ncbi:site-2 protease family protein [Candidatus Woesearchaeota archaeon]|jgi:membrane-associated protease RseP (regulator of RpoE activity)|nr:site-2 protease family protein [Candidatus Woesearchaeota archaeon]
MSFVDSGWFVLSFYVAIVLLVYLNRKHFIIQSKIIALYKTKIGLKLMDSWSSKYREYFRVLGFIGIGVGFAGVIGMFYLLVKNLVDIVMMPSAASAVSLVIPGVAVPGSPVTIPLFSGWIALFLVVVVHEFSHGVIARTHKIKVKSSGIFFLGPLMGAFVEPDEKQLRASSDTTQYSVYAAGPFSNVLLAIACLALLSFAFNPLADAMVNPLGVQVVDTFPNMSAADAGIQKDMVITQVNGVEVRTFEDFSSELKYLRPGDDVQVKADNKKFSFEVGPNPDDERSAFLGVMVSSAPKTELKSELLSFKILSWIVKAILELLVVTAILSLGIGLANLLPLGPVDGGRMLQVLTHRAKGKTKGNKIWKRVALITLILLAVNLIWPFIQWLLNVAV